TDGQVGDVLHGLTGVEEIGAVLGPAVTDQGGGDDDGHQHAQVGDELGGLGRGLGLGGPAYPTVGSVSSGGGGVGSSGRQRRSPEKAKRGGRIRRGTGGRI